MLTWSPQIIYQRRWANNVGIGYRTAALQ
jgi:hypothetical protein